MSITTEEIELLAQTHDLVRFTLGMKAPEHDLTSAALRSLAAERDALRAERNAERNARFKAEAEFSHMQRRIARQRRALAKLYRKRHDRNGRLSSFVTGLTAENARLKEAVKECADDLEAEITHRYGDMVPKYPRERLKRDQDMAPVLKVRALLGETQ